MGWGARSIVPLLIGLVLLGGCLAPVSDTPMEEASPTVTPTVPPAPTRTPAPTTVSQSISTVTLRYRFPFDGSSDVSVAIPVDIPAYHAARTLEKSIPLPSPDSEDRRVAEFYRSLIEDPTQQSVYRGALAALRQVRQDLDLSDDQYLELIAFFVQSIPYQTSHGAPRSPIETLVENRGDCDDKSLLLSALLAREGYNVSLLYFKEEKHMGVGIADDRFPYRETGYAYIETTRPSFVGIAPLEIDAGRVLRSTPLVIRVGDGERAFQSGGETRAIQTVLTGLEETLPACLPASVNLESLPPEDELAMDAACRGDYLAYQYILSHVHERAGTYRWLAEQGRVPAALA